MRYFLYDVLNDYSIAKVDGKSDFGTLEHAKRRAQKDNQGKRVIWSKADIPPRTHKHWYGRNNDNELINLITTHGLLTNPKLRQKGNTKVIVGPGKELTVRLYATDIVKILADGSIQLNSGGHKTATTKRRMNEPAQELELYFNVISKRGKWYVETEDRLEPPQTIEYSDGMIISGPQHLRNPKRKTGMARKKKRSAKQLANDKRLGRMAKARAKKKRGAGRKKYTRTKRATKKTRRNPRRKVARGASVSKRSHLFLIFACKGKQIKFQGVTVWTTKKANAIYFKRKSEASKEAHYRAKQNLPTVRGWQIGVAPDTLSSAQIVAQCNAGK
jgi:hypothetical protein